MYCKNCGSNLNDGDSVCTNCGTPVGEGSNNCPNCGTSVTPGSSVCIACGQSLNGNVEVIDGSSSSYSYSSSTSSAPKSKMAAGLLGIFLGSWGVHNFYLGNTKRGIIQIIVTLCTCGIGGWWGIIEGIMILCGSINTDANGNPLSD